jgi:hypothetical protein
MLNCEWEEALYMPRNFRAKSPAAADEGISVWPKHMN